MVQQFSVKFGGKFKLQNTIDRYVTWDELHFVYQLLK